MINWLPFPLPNRIYTCQLPIWLPVTISVIKYQLMDYRIIISRFVLTSFTLWFFITSLHYFCNNHIMNPFHHIISWHLCITLHGIMSITFQYVMISCHLLHYVIKLFLSMHLYYIWCHLHYITSFVLLHHDVICVMSWWYSIELHYGIGFYCYTNTIPWSYLAWAKDLHPYQAATHT